MKRAFLLMFSFALLFCASAFSQQGVLLYFDPLQHNLYTLDLDNPDATPKLYYNFGSPNVVANSIAVGEAPDYPVFVSLGNAVVRLADPGQRGVADPSSFRFFRMQSGDLTWLRDEKVLSVGTLAELKPDFTAETGTLPPSGASLSPTLRANDNV